MERVNERRRGASGERRTANGERLRDLVVVASDPLSSLNLLILIVVCASTTSGFSLARSLPDERIASPRGIAAHPFLSLLSNIIVTGPSFTRDTCIMAPKTPSFIRCAPSGYATSLTCWRNAS